MPICAICWIEIRPQNGDVCFRCGDTLDIPVANPGISALCRACRLAPPPFVRAVAYGLYQGRMRAAIHAFKYNRMHPAGRRLGEMLASAIAQLAGEAPAEMLVVPVPLHRSKLAERGFNQSRLLARMSLRCLRRTHPEWKLTLAPKTLMRLRVTESQAGLAPRERRLNVRGAFSVSDPLAVKDKHILLVDDVFTTGATARATSAVLMRAGAASVWVATLARARRTRQIATETNFENADGIAVDSALARIASGVQASANSSHHQPSF